MESFWGVIVGGFISLAGVLVTLRWNQRVHEDNLREERRKIREEREFSAKQAALLSACEALTRFINYYISLADRILPSDGTVSQEITELNVAFNRLHFYCELETIEKSICLSQVLNNAIGATMKAKMPSGFIAAELKAIDVQTSGIEKMNASLQDEINAILQSDPQNRLLASRNEQLAKNFQKMGDLAGQRVELIERKYIETEKCRDVVLAHLRTIYESARDVLMLARRELSFPIDEQRYRVLIDECMESMEGTVQEFFAELRKQIADEMQADKARDSDGMNGSE